VGEKQDGLELLEMLRKVCFNFQEHKFGPLAITQVKQKYFGFKQVKGTMLPEYYESFVNVRGMLKQCKVNTGANPGIIDWMVKKKHGTKKSLADLSADEKTAVHDAKDEQQAALIFLYGAEQSHYGAMIEELENAYLGGQNNFPATVIESYNWLLYWSSEAHNHSI